MNKVVVIVGMCGSGKSIASDYLVEKGYEKVYFGGVTMEKLKENNLEVNPENEKMIREKLRADLGMGAFSIILLPRIKKYLKSKNVVLDGLYSWDEYKIIEEELGGQLFVISIVADKELRYSRLSKREVRPLTPDEAKARDLAEIENIRKAPPIAYADYYVLNNGTFDEYKAILDEILNIIERS